LLAAFLSSSSSSSSSARLLVSLLYLLSEGKTQTPLVLLGFSQVDFRGEVTLHVLGPEVSVDGQGEDGVGVDLAEDGAVAVVIVEAPTVTL